MWQPKAKLFLPLFRLLDQPTGKWPLLAEHLPNKILRKILNILKNIKNSLNFLV